MISRRHSALHLAAYSSHHARFPIFVHHSKRIDNAWNYQDSAILTSQGGTSKRWTVKNIFGKYSPDTRWIHWNILAMIKTKGPDGAFGSSMRLKSSLLVYSRTCQGQRWHRPRPPNAILTLHCLRQWSHSLTLLPEIRECSRVPTETTTILTLWRGERCADICKFVNFYLFTSALGWSGGT